MSKREPTGERIVASIPSIPEDFPNLLCKHQSVGCLCDVSLLEWPFLFFSRVFVLDDELEILKLIYWNPF